MLTAGGRAQPDSIAAIEAAPSQGITPMRRIAFFATIQSVPPTTAKERNAQNVKLIAPKKAKVRQSDRDVLGNMLLRRRLAWRFAFRILLVTLAMAKYFLRRSSP